jgi:ParB family chromosome partitioning protein
LAQTIQVVKLRKIRPNRLNPRLEINIERLNELANSIRKVGLLQPLIVRSVDDGYEVVVGERRYRACQQAGLETVPVIVRHYTDNQVIELNLIENIQREDLSAVEKAKSCKQLRDRFPDKYPTWESVAETIGIDPQTVRSWVRTLDLPEEVQRLVASKEIRQVPEGKIDYTTALHIVGRIKEPKRQIEVAREIAKRRIPQREAREVIREIARAPKRPVEESIQKVLEAPYEMPFRLNHMEPILKGVKTQTSRRGIPDPRVKAGAIVHAAVWEPRFADLRITSIERKRLGDFTEEDARREGGYSLKEFKEVWESIHGKGSWNPDERVDMIRFDLVKRGRRSS